jgi:hypothetical protein
LLVGPPDKQLTVLTERVRKQLVGMEPPVGESWDMWWQAARAEPAFEGLLAERTRIFEDHPHHEHIGAPFHEAALQQAGFAETAVVWRYLDDTIVCALR